MLVHHLFQNLYQSKNGITRRPYLIEKMIEDSLEQILAR